LNLQPGRNEIVEESAQAEASLGFVLFLMVTAAAFHFWLDHRDLIQAIMRTGKLIIAELC
jgi:hypothetical protein